MISAPVIQHCRFEGLDTESQFNPKEISIDRGVLYNGHAGLGANASARACDSSKNEVAVESLEVRLMSRTSALVLMADHGGQFFSARADAGAEAAHR